MSSTMPAYKETLVNDTEHWQGLKPPLSPNAEEISIYADQIRGMKPVCLLGMTKELIPLCDHMADLNPIEVPKRVLKCDWMRMEELSDAIIGDGVLNLAGMGLVDRMRGLCNRFVCRVFTRKLPGMKYAQNFPNEFPEADLVVRTQEDVVIVAWKGLRPS